MKDNRINCILLISVLLLQFAQSTALPPPPPLSQSGNLSLIQSNHRVTIILVCIIVVMACVFVYVRYRYYAGPRLPRTASALAATSGLLAGDSLDADVLNSFPTFVYSEVKALKTGMGGLECAVCLNEFEDDETLRLIPHCSHVFHSDCIDKWLSSHVTCPVCRADVTKFLPIVQSPIDSRGVSREESIRETSRPTSDAVVDEIVIPIESSIASRFTTKMGMLEHVVPSGSGGNKFVVKPGEDQWDRFTLRLPEEVQSRLMGSRMNRTRSCVVFGRARSPRKEYQMGSVGHGRVYKNFLYSEQGD